MEFLLPLALVVGLPLLIVVIMDNGFISRRNAMRDAFSLIDVQLKKRWDLIPNLGETVKKYASHEKEGMEAVVKARNASWSGVPVSGMACGLGLAIPTCGWRSQSWTIGLRAMLTRL